MNMTIGTTLAAALLLSSCSGRGVLVKNKPEDPPPRPLLSMDSMDTANDAAESESGMTTAMAPGDQPMTTASMDTGDNPTENPEKTTAEQLVDMHDLAERQAAYIAVLEQRVRDLEGQLGTSGRGAYATGVTISLDSDTAFQPQETVLDRLHWLGTQLAKARESLAADRREMEQMRSKAIANGARADELQFRVEILESAEDQLEIVRQEHADALGKVAVLESRIAAAEIARLKAERRHFELVRELLALRTDEARRLIELQSRIRGEIAESRPSDLGPQDPVLRP